MRFQCPYLLEGGNEERDRRLEVVKFLTAFPYCVVGGSFIICVPELVLGSLSLLRDACQRRNLESWLGECGWVGTGCWWVSGLSLGALFTIILRVALTVNRYASENKPRIVGGWVQVGGC